MTETSIRDADSHNRGRSALPELKSAELSASANRQKQQQLRSLQKLFAPLCHGFIFSGVLLGLLPMWNSAVFIAAAAVFGLLFILFPLRLQMLALAVTAGLIALPQMLYSEHRER